MRFHRFPSVFRYTLGAGVLAFFASLILATASKPIAPPPRAVAAMSPSSVASQRSGGLQAASRASALGLRELAPALVSRKLAPGQTPTAFSHTGNLSPARPRAAAAQGGGQPPHSKALRAEPSATTNSTPGNRKSPIQNPKLVETYGQLPLSFEANQGQTDSQVKFLSRGPGYTLFLTGEEAVLSLSSQKSVRQLTDRSQQPASRNSKWETGNWKLETGNWPISNLQSEISNRQSLLPRPTDSGPRPTGAFLSPSSDNHQSSIDNSSVLRLRLVGANANARVTGLDPLPGKSNYFIGNDPQKWRTNVSNYAKVRYADVYPGVDLVYYGNQGQLEYDFVVSPGADLRAIALSIEGADKMEVDARGDLVLQTHGGDVRLHKPVVYQPTTDNGRLTTDGPANSPFTIHHSQFVDGRFVLFAANRIGFEVPRYDRSLPLVIDPVLSYSTYLGGSGGDGADGIAVDSSGNAYVTGSTSSTDFPTQNPLQPANMGSDAFVAKLDATGTNLIYSTYLGGTSGDVGRGVAVDSSGNAYVVGGTCSTDFPVVRPFQVGYGGGCGYWYGDAFVVKLDASGSSLIYSTYLGGGDDDEGRAIAVDFAGNVYVTGGTSSGDFPLQNPLQSGNNTASMIFVTKLDASGSSLVYSTYLGGGFDEFGYAIAVDSSGSAYVTGETWSEHFPTVNAVQPTLGGEFWTDAFVTKFNPAGSALVYSTYLGGSYYDEGLGIAVDSLGNAYVTGYTCSGDFPLANPLQVAHGGGCSVGNGPPYSIGYGDAFVAELDPTGSSLVYSTYLGGADLDVARGVATDSSGNAYVTGQTLSADFPSSSPLQAPYGGNGDGFLTKLNATGSALVFSTYVGGSSSDGGASVALDDLGNAYIAGGSSSLDFPTANPFQAAFAGGSSDAFVAKLTGLALPVVALTPTTLDFGEQLLGVTSAPKTVTLTNAGDAALDITSIVASGDFAQTNTCGSSVAVGASCTVSVAFTPPLTVPGGQSGTLTIAHDASGSPHTVALNGIGLGPVASLSTNTLSFAGQIVGTTSPVEAVTLTNSGNAPLSISSITATGDYALTHNCVSPLAAEASCTISVTFAPTVAGGRSGTLIITDNAAGSPRTVGLSGVGQDFSLGAFTTARAVSPGMTARFNLLLMPQGGFQQTVSLACSGAPAGATCSVRPSSVTPNGVTNVSVALEVVTTAPAASAPRDGGGRRSLPPGGWPVAMTIALLGALALLAGVILRRAASSARLRLLPVLGACLLLVALVWAACGGGGLYVRSGGTPAGTYMLTITATTSDLSHSTTVELTVR